MKQKTLTDWIELFLPCYRWISRYKWREYLQPDLMAGVTVGVMLVPQVPLIILIGDLLLFDFLNFLLIVVDDVCISPCRMQN